MGIEEILFLGLCLVGLWVIKKLIIKIFKLEHDWHNGNARGAFISFLYGFGYIYIDFLDALFKVIFNGEKNLELSMLPLGIFGIILGCIFYTLLKIPEYLQFRKIKSQKKFLREELINIPIGLDFFTIANKFSSLDYVYEPELEEDVENKKVYVWWLDWQVKDMVTNKQRFAYFTITFENGKYISKNDSDLYRNATDFYLQ